MKRDLFWKVPEALVWALASGQMTFALSCKTLTKIFRQNQKQFNGSICGGQSRRWLKVSHQPETFEHLLHPLYNIWMRTKLNVESLLLLSHTTNSAIRSSWSPSSVTSECVAQFAVSLLWLSTRFMSFLLLGVLWLKKWMDIGWTQSQFRRVWKKAKKKPK